MGGQRFDEVRGPLAGFDAGFGAELARLGYVPRVVELRVRLMADVSVFMPASGCDVASLG